MRQQRKMWRLVSIILLALIAGLIAMPSSWSFKGNLPDNAMFQWLKGEKIQLGLDLQGGTQLKYRIDLSGVPAADQDQIVEGIISVIRKRVDKLGVAEPVIQSSQIGASSYVIVELPGIKNIDEAIGAVGKTVQLEFKEPKTEYTEAELTEIKAYNDEQKVKADEALSRALQSEDFTKLVQEFSEGQGLVNDGIQEFRSQETLPADFMDPVAGLTDGQVYNQVVDVADGYYLVKLLESRNEIKTTTDENGNEVNAEERQVKIQLVRLNKKSEVPEGGWKETGLTGKQFKHASVEYDQSLNFRVLIQFNDEGKQLFSDITSRNVGQPVAIFLDNEPISTPTVQEPILDGEAVITGSFTQKDANDLAMNLNTGAIPAPIILIGQSNIGATLGQNALSQGIQAGLIGVLILGIYMIAYYRLPGLIADIALVIYALILLALFKFLGVTLTLAGVAGVILSIGMAVDANILIFERFKEEVRSGKTLMNSIEIGFNRAWNSIRDSNLSSLITCTILFIFGTGIIKGFAVTLAIGILVSMFTAINVTRALLMIFTIPVLSKKLSLWGVNPEDVGTTQSFDEESRAEKRRNRKKHQ
jgi:protein-export membrane protein SecD